MKLIINIFLQKIFFQEEISTTFLHLVRRIFKYGKKNFWVEKSALTICLPQQIQYPVKMSAARTFKACVTLRGISHRYNIYLEILELNWNWMDFRGSRCIVRGEYLSPLQSLNSGASRRFLDIPLFSVSVWIIQRHMKHPHGGS